MLTSGDLMDASLNAMAVGDYETAIALAREANAWTAQMLEFKNLYMPRPTSVEPPKG